MDIRSSHLLLDTCCLLNFHASGQCLEILQVIPAQVAIVEEVKQELTQSDLTEIEQAIAENLLIAVDFASDSEAENFVNYAAARLGDGEAATGAIAVERKWAIATDDRKAIKFFTQEAQSLQIFSTLEIIKYWSETQVIQPLQVQETLHNIQVQGRYTPAENHPLKSWWDKFLDRG
ncbi:MAG: hypothetical protein J7545_05805 [Roseofilum sp. SBFL]|uniref:hypothetical protein n=1 Tax=unclassified Roseofilum TaxID=2620099 RepID=UPI001AFEDB27|nr:MULTISPECIES: hypothetical protein [unclassified Roseofilum]MBP0014458.1 hypothetical protein [Roseofilum sp. SID3]MBP0024192.1 hypothetical protein [Roseofilum sp. SID2]MBP0037018.1 hypothetical protein [Roseofilum sp. SID1]MBP0041476.1 hypothetical protein [Roseofilum sp. SBFL]